MGPPLSQGNGYSRPSRFLRPQCSLHGELHQLKDFIPRGKKSTGQTQVPGHQGWPGGRTPLPLTSISLGETALRL